MNAGRNNFNYFLYPFLGLWVAGLTFLSIKGYKDSFIILNSHYNTWLDFPFYLITHIGNGLMILSLLTFLWSKDKLNLIICAILSVVLSGLMVQLLKNFLFNNWSRPLIVLYNINPPIHIYGDYRLLDNTFPSGHSTTIASVFTIVAFAYQNKSKLFLILLSIIAAIIIYTRVYLGVHFLGDILAGSILGGSFSFLIVNRMLHPITNKVSKIYQYHNTVLYLRILGGIMFLVSIFVVYKNL